MPNTRNTLVPPAVPRTKAIAMMPPKHAYSALKILNLFQKIVFLFLFVLIGLLFVYNWHATLVTLVTILTIIYFLDLIFNLSIIFRSSAAPTEIQISPAEIAKKHIWPTYTIFCPLYKEAHILPQFIKAMEG